MTYEHNKKVFTRWSEYPITSRLPPLGMFPNTYSGPYIVRDLFHNREEEKEEEGWYGEDDRSRGTGGR